MKKTSFWSRFRMAMRNHLPLTVIVAAALMLQLTTAVMYYSAQHIIQKKMEQLAVRDIEAIYLTIHNKLAKVEVTVNNMAWVVSDGLDEPDWMFSIVRRMVDNNPSFRGSGIAFLPYYYAQEGRFFEPYAMRHTNGTVETLQLGKDNEDHTQDEYFRVPVTQGKAHWSEPYMDPDGAKTIVTTYGVPVRDSKGETVGVAYADISLNWLDAIMEKSKYYKTTQRFLLSGSFTRLAGQDSQLLKKIIELLKKDQDRTGHVTTTDEKGEKMQIFFHPVGGKTDWILVCACNNSEIFGPMKRVRLLLGLMVVACLLLIGFIVFRTSHSLERLRKINAEKERISGELRIATNIQKEMLPKNLPPDPERDDIDIFGMLIPAREVGGDLYDFFLRDEKLFFCIGDVSGKGVPAALVMAVIHSMFRMASAHENNPARIMQTINEISCQGNESNIFVTLFLGVLDLPTGLLRYCNAGHDAPISIEKGSCSLFDVKPHLPLGVFDDVAYDVQEMRMEPDSTIFLYTDGLTEAKNQERKLFGMERIQEILTQCANSHLKPQDILETVTEKVRLFAQGAEQSDDLTMLAIHYMPQQFKSILSEALLLKNNLVEVKKLSSFLKSVVEQSGMEPSMGKQFRLAVEEAVVNVIDYAYPAGEEGDIEIRILSDGRKIITTICDSGVRFDPTEKEKADTSLSVEDRQIGGLGILLVRELMDSINYERVNHRNVLTLVKKMKDEK